MNAPEKIYIDPEVDPMWDMDKRFHESDIEYTRTDAFIEKALKWYCLDCECNNNCKDAKCFFYREYERYLKGEANAVPPKFSGRIIEEDSSISVNYRYRHFISRLQEASIEKVINFLKYKLADVVATQVTGTIIPGHVTKQELIEDFKNYMEGE